ncbi:MAG: hypothetical protein K8R23_12700 [Chthoniobacter sp.]|nr:hypothetical protein [Chthoniobacter sp.]
MSWPFVPVLKAESDLSASRLTLCALTARTLKEGLALLGIGVPERCSETGNRGCLMGGATR